MSPTPEPDALFTRAEVQRGLPDKRASTLLFLIECVVMQQVRRFQTIVMMAGAAPEVGAWSAYLATDDGPALPEVDLRDPIAAFKLARQGKGIPTAWEIENHAAKWGPGVPENPNMRAATARLMAQKYHFTAEMAKGIRHNLGLDTPAVQAAFQAMYGVPLATIYAPRITLADRVRAINAKIADVLAGAGRARGGGAGEA